MALQQRIHSLATSQPRWKTSPSLGLQRSLQPTGLPVTPLLQICVSPSLGWVGHPPQTAWTESLKRVVVLVFRGVCFGFFFAMPLSRWDLSSLTRVQTHAPCIGSTRLNHPIPREIPRRVIV